ncbi:MAG: hypothetical protein IKM51_03555 [Oscillospiraceae bacterium]|nr:hypothetical protein [Oscillospiraceae bacterium]
MHELHIYKNLPFEANIDELAQNPFFKGDACDPEIKAAWQSAACLAAPSVMVRQVDVVHSEQGVCEIGGQKVSSSVLDKNLAGLHRAFAYVATCGKELALVQSENESVKSALFILRMQALRTAMEFAMSWTKEHFSLSKTATVNPGSLPQWPITEQPVLFAMIGDVKGELGIELTKTMFMWPSESASGLIFETEHDYKNCMACKKLDCIGRQAPYDESLAAELDAIDAKR